MRELAVSDLGRDAGYGEVLALQERLAGARVEAALAQPFRVEVSSVDRQRIDRTSLKRALSLLDEGKIVCIFPEGTRSKTGALLPPLPGAAFLVRKAGVSVCPVALQRKKRIFGNNLFPCYHVHVGATFSVNKPGRRDLQADADLMMAKIKELLEDSI